MKRWNRGIIGVLVCVVFVAWAAGYRWVNPAELVDHPKIGFSIRSATKEGDRITAEWYVENCWDKTLTFEENQIAQVELNNEPVPYSTEAVTLEPGESRTYSIEIEGARKTLNNTLTILASCAEGGSVSMTVTVQPEE